METILAGIGFWGAGILIGILSKTVIPKWIGKIAARFRKDLKAKAKEYLKDPEWRAIGRAVILKVQKDAGSKKGEQLKNEAIKWFQKLIPTNLDDEIVAAIIESLYNEMKIEI